MKQQIKVIKNDQRHQKQKNKNIPSGIPIITSNPYIKKLKRNSKTSPLYKKNIRLKQQDEHLIDEKTNLKYHLRNVKPERKIISFQDYNDMPDPRDGAIPGGSRS